MLWLLSPQVKAVPLQDDLSQGAMAPQSPWGLDSHLRANNVEDPGRQDPFPPSSTAMTVRVSAAYQAPAPSSKQNSLSISLSLFLSVCLWVCWPLPLSVSLCTSLFIFPSTFNPLSLPPSFGILQDTDDLCMNFNFCLCSNVFCKCN